MHERGIEGVEGDDCLLILTHLLTDEPILSFQRNAFFLLKHERKLLDPKTDHQNAIDLLFNEVISIFV